MRILGVIHFIKLQLKRHFKTTIKRRKTTLSSYNWNDISKQQLNGEKPLYQATTETTFQNNN